MRHAKSPLSATRTQRVGVLWDRGHPARYAAGTAAVHSLPVSLSLPHLTLPSPPQGGEGFCPRRAGSCASS
jgi:hypothetical protein